MKGKKTIEEGKELDFADVSKENKNGTWKYKEYDFSIHMEGYSQNGNSTCTPKPSRISAFKKLMYYLHNPLSYDDVYGNILLANLMELETNDIAKFLLAIYEEGKTPLLFVIGEAKYTIVKYLVKHGADLNIKNKDSKTLLHYAVKKNDLKMVKLLLSINPVDIDKIKELIIISSRNMEVSKEELMKKTEFITKFVDLNEVDKDLKTPLHYAVENNDLKMVKLLVQHGADVNKKDKDSKTPLHYASENKNENMVKYLEKRRANMEKKISKIPIEDIGARDKARSY